MSNDDLLERCKEILEWQKTGILSGTALQNYAESKFSGLVNNLTVAEAATAREAMTELIAAQSRHEAEREALVKDAERYRWLKNKPCWNIELVKADGTHTSNADRFASRMSKNYSDMTCEWSVSFYTDYGMLSPDHDELDDAIDTAMSLLSDSGSQG